MAKSDPQTSGSEPGGIADESASAIGEAAGSDATLSEDERWGFTDKKPGMPSETKAGIAIVLVLVCAFGFIAYTKYGKGLKDATIAAIKGPASGGEQDDTVSDSEPQPAPQETPAPSAFGPEGEDQRIAANENDFLGDQGEPPSATPDQWGVTSQQPTAPASATELQQGDPDGFTGFEDRQPVAATTKPAVQTTVTDVSDPVASFESSDPFGDDAFGDTVQTQPKTTPAQPATPANDLDPWGDAGSATVATREPATIQPREPAAFQPAKPEPASTQPPTTADPFGDDFGMDADPVAVTSVPQQPAAWKDPADVQPKSPAGPDPFGDSFGDSFESTQEVTRAPVAVDEPAPRKPEPAPVDSFEDTGIDFNDGFESTPVRREIVAQPAKPPQRFDRDGFDRVEETPTRTPARVDRTVGRPVETSSVSSYTVRQSDTYWSISKKVYGTSRYYRALAKYNERIIKDPRRMPPGTRLDVPTQSELERLYPEMFSSIRRASATRIDTRQPSGLYLDGNGRPYYRVGSGDTLDRIAYRHLGSSSRYREIFELNRNQLASPGSIRPGMRLAMPANASHASYR